MKNFADRLSASVDGKKSCVVVGLDPRIERLPAELRERAERSPAEAAAAILEFNRRVLKAVAPHVVAAKPQVAFYEALGPEGMRVFADTIRAAHEQDLLVIADMKRGDIGSTAEAYAQACFDRLGADAVTLNPYLGSDAIQPFLKRAPEGKGVFVLVKTSNPSSVEIQDLDAGGQPLYEKVATLVDGWGEDFVGESGYSAVGAVVGATFPGAVRKLRKLMPRATILLPGYGAQGATAKDCRPAFDSEGHGAVVNSSRGIIFAFAERAPASDKWEDSVAEAAKRMKEELESVRGL